MKNINLNEDSQELLQWFATATTLTVSDLIDRLVSANLSDLWELRTLMEARPELHNEAVNLIVSFGPEPLSQGIDRIAPAGYETLQAQFRHSMVGPYVSTKQTLL